MLSSTRLRHHAETHTGQAVRNSKGGTGLATNFRCPKDDSSFPWNKSSQENNRLGLPLPFANLQICDSTLNKDKSDGLKACRISERQNTTQTCPSKHSFGNKNGEGEITQGSFIPHMLLVSTIGAADILGLIAEDYNPAKEGCRSG